MGAGGFPLTHFDEAFFSMLKLATNVFYYIVLHHLSGATFDVFLIHDDDVLHP